MPDFTTVKQHRDITIKSAALCLMAVALFIIATPFLEAALPSKGLLFFSLAAMLLCCFPDIMKYSNVLTTTYIALMFVAMLFHWNMPTVKDPMMEFVIWISPVLFMVAARNPQLRFGLLGLAVIVLFTLSCGVNLYEKITLSHPIDFNNEILEESFIPGGEADDDLFRSFGLVGHPLDNANTLSILISFIMVSALRPMIKWPLVGVGLLSIWAINSRAGLLMWVVIIIYVLFLQNKKWYVVLINVILLGVVLPAAIEYIQMTGMLGRLDFDFSDDSTLTRVESFIYFSNENWNFEKIVYGGELIFMPGTGLLLENGLLLNMGYWGWIIGVAKLALELIITYKMLDGYKRNQKVIIMLAAWGVAVMNNNSFNRLVLYYFAFSLVAFRGFNHLVANTKWGVEEEDEEESVDEESKGEESEEEETKEEQLKCI